MYVYIHTYMYIYIQTQSHIHTYTYLYVWLKIVEFASLNANHFWSKCETLWPTYSQYVWVTGSQFRLIENYFC